MKSIFYKGQLTSEELAQLSKQQLEIRCAFLEGVIKGKEERMMFLESLIADAQQEAKENQDELDRELTNHINCEEEYAN